MSSDAVVIDFLCMLHSPDAIDHDFCSLTYLCLYSQKSARPGSMRTFRCLSAKGLDRVTLRLRVLNLSHQINEIPDLSTIIFPSTLPLSSIHNKPSLPELMESPTAVT